MGKRPCAASIWGSTRWRSAAIGRPRTVIARRLPISHYTNPSAPWRCCRCLLLSLPSPHLLPSGASFAEQGFGISERTPLSRVRQHKPCPEVSEMASAKTASAIDVRIDDVGPILKFHIGFPFGEDSAGFYKSVWLPGSRLNFRIGSVSSIGGLIAATLFADTISDYQIVQIQGCRLGYLEGSAAYLRNGTRFSKGTCLQHGVRQEVCSPNPWRVLLNLFWGVPLRFLSVVNLMTCSFQCFA